jgi:hypothetical protein
VFVLQIFSMCVCLKQNNNLKKKKQKQKPRCGNLQKISFFLNLLEIYEFIEVFLSY